MPVNRLLVVATVCFGMPGLALLFGADDVLRLGGASTPTTEWLTGMLGAALVALALLNWYQRHTLMGGIYGRPLLMANLLVLATATFSSLRHWRTDGSVHFAVTCGVAGILLAAFGRLLFRTPPSVGRVHDASDT
jgi:hypothetical protein